MIQITSCPRATIAVVAWLATAATASVLLQAGTASAQGVLAQTDCWETEPGTKAKLPPLPPNFFAPGSDPFVGGDLAVIGLPLTGPELSDCSCPPSPQTDVAWVDIHGDPVPAGSVHAVSQVPTHASTTDTCVRRLANATFPGGVGVPDTVPIELVQLSLVSVSPIVVTFGGSPSQWNVFITEDGVQAPGAMEFTPSTLAPAPQGVVRVPNLPVDFQFRFERIGLPGTALLSGNVNMQNPNPQAPGPPGTFQVMTFQVPALPATGILLLGGALAFLGIVWLRRRQIMRAAV